MNFINKSYKYNREKKMYDLNLVLSKTIILSISDLRAQM